MGADGYRAHGTARGEGRSDSEPGTAKAAQALHAANVQERALESSEQKERRRWRWPWDRQDG